MDIVADCIDRRNNTAAQRGRHQFAVRIENGEVIGSGSSRIQLRHVADLDDFNASRQLGGQAVDPLVDAHFGGPRFADGRTALHRQHADFGPPHGRALRKMIHCGNDDGERAVDRRCPIHVAADTKEVTGVRSPTQATAGEIGPVGRIDKHDIRLSRGRRPVDRSGGVIPGTADIGAEPSLTVCCERNGRRRVVGEDQARSINRAITQTAVRLLDPLPSSGIGFRLDLEEI